MGCDLSKAACCCGARIENRQEHFSSECILSAMNIYDNKMPCSLEQIASAKYHLILCQEFLGLYCGLSMMRSRFHLRGPGQYIGHSSRVLLRAAMVGEMENLLSIISTHSETQSTQSSLLP